MFSRRSSCFHNRPWLLLLFLPFFWWSISGAATHFHRADGSEESWFSTDAAAICQAQSSTRSHQATLVADHHTHLALEKTLCLSCHWNTHASALFAGSAQLALFNARPAVFCEVFASLPRRAILHAANRGPPLRI